MSTSSNIAMIRVSMPGWRDVSWYSNSWSERDFHGSLKMISMLNHLSSCLHADSDAQPQAPLSEILGQSLFRPRLPANAHGSQISPWHWKLVLWGAVDFNSQAEQSSRWSMQRGHTSGAVGSSCCLAFWSSKKESELWDMETSAHGNQLADEAGWNSNGRIRNQLYPFCSCFMSLWRAALQHLLQCFKISLLEKPK